jgi:hypothetical protein
VKKKQKYSATNKLSPTEVLALGNVIIIHQKLFLIMVDGKACNA